MQAWNDVNANFTTPEFSFLTRVNVANDYVFVGRCDVQKQTGSVDCGVYTIRFAGYASRRAAIDFDQSHMTYFRQRTAIECLNQHILGSENAFQVDVE